MNEVRATKPPRQACLDVLYACAGKHVARCSETGKHGRDRQGLTGAAGRAGRENEASLDRSNAGKKTELRMFGSVSRERSARGEHCFQV